MKTIYSYLAEGNCVYEEKILTCHNNKEMTWNINETIPLTFKNKDSKIL